MEDKTILYSVRYPSAQEEGERIKVRGDRQAAEACVNYIRGLSKSLGMPQTLKELKGVDPEKFGDLADLAVKDFCMGDNLVRADREQVIEVYGEAWRGGI